MNKYTRLLSTSARFGLAQGLPGSRTQLCRPVIQKTPRSYFEVRPNSGPLFAQQAARFGGGRGRGFPKNQLILVGAGGVLFGAYYFTHLEAVPISGRSRMVGISAETEAEMAKTEWERIKEELGNDILPDSDRRVKLVKSLAAPIIKESGLSKLDWEFIVVDQDMANAFVLPGGKVCVFTGIMKIASDPGELATVLSHEIGHVVARHNAEKWTFAQIVFVGGAALKFVLGDYVPDQIINVFLQYVMALPFSRKCESEADHIGLILMSKACYDPNKAVELWTKFEQTDKNAGGNSEFLKFTSTHPSHHDRVKHVQDLLPQAYEVRKDSHCERFNERMRKSFF